MNLEDNRHGHLAEDRPSHRLCGGTDFIRRWADLPLSDWSEAGVQVFTRDGSTPDDGSSRGQPVFTLGGGNGTTWVNTHNVMGVVRLREEGTGKCVQLQIGSRFDSGHPRPYFLTYLLGRVFGGSVVREVDIGQESMWDLLLAFAFRRKLLEAAAVGLFKEYRTMHHDDLRLRGRIDLARHLRTNVPFRGKVAYVTREASFDNPLNHLIRHAMAKVARKWPRLLEGDAALAGMVRQLGQNTPSWTFSDARGCLGRTENRKPVRHPYFQAAYEPLRKICRSILHDEGAGLYQQEQEADGVLFDGAWLWEEYLWILLEPRGYQHPRNTSGRGGLRAIPGATFYPDFYHREKRIVLDAKYKRAAPVPPIEDVRQVLAYMLLTDARHGGLIRPSGGRSGPEDITNHGPPDGVPLRRWHELSLAPQPATTAAAFIRGMEDQEARFREALELLEKP
jgi:5-methylcytosine-specific restriction endonuclease McrBC regulatory subunit McrC